MKLSVIIPCYNDADVIGDQLEALGKQDFAGEWEVIVANNGSTDSLAAIVSEYAGRVPGLRMVDASARKGQPFALNTGVRHSTGEAVAFCDADDVVSDGWVRVVANALGQYDLIASRFDFERLNPYAVYGGRPNSQCRGLQTYRDPPFLSYAGGCGLGVKRSLHDKIGGFDETLLLLHDTDYCWRLQLQGVALTFVEEAVVHVRLRRSLWQTFQQAAGFGEYAVLLYKRYSDKGMPRISIRRSLRAWARMFLFARPGTAAGRYSWARRFGWRIGRLKGSIKYGTAAF